MSTIKEQASQLMATANDALAGVSSVVSENAAETASQIVAYNRTASTLALAAVILAVAIFVPLSFRLLLKESKKNLADQSEFVQISSGVCLMVSLIGGLFGVPFLVGWFLRSWVSPNVVIVDHVIGMF